MQRLWFPAALLLVTLNSATAQEKSAAKHSIIHKHRELSPQPVYVYYRSWEGGELKECQTFSGYPYLLVCDNESLVELAAHNATSGMSEARAYDYALSTLMTRSRKFLVKFFDDYNRNPEPWPKPRTGLTLASWECTKTTVMSCEFGARLDPEK
jgi:hypothetical protein